MKILITGGTGFLGQYLVREIAPLFDEIYVLSRNIDTNIFSRYPNVKLVAGDITNPQMPEELEKSELLLSEIDIILHAAALYDIKASYSESYLHNVFGTQNILRLARKIEKLRAFYYVSTIAVGDEDSFFLEEDHLPIRKSFNDHYSETKYHAERMVREKNAFFPVRVIRPGIIVGDSQTGKMQKADGPYYFMDVLKKHSLILKTLPFVPFSFNPRSKLPIIPVDHCARFIALLLSRDQFTPELKTYHLISHEVPTLAEFLRDLNQALGLRAEYVPVFKNPIHNSLLKLLGIPKELVPFMFSKTSYDKTRTIEELPELLESKYSEYKEKFFLYLA